MPAPRAIRRFLNVLMAVFAAFGRPYQPEPPERTAIVLHAQDRADHSET